jgi:serine/threonine protein kinase/tetratricopeptide (TPR) repeat protein
VAIKCPKCHSENPETKQYCADCGTQLPPPRSHPPVMTETLQTPVRELTTGSTFAGRYQVIEELGHGGMGRVYKVFDTKIKEKIALKLIKPEIASDKETIERFGNELRLARKISQRNVCRMFDIGEAEGAHFITMEYVHGEDLKSMIHMTGSLSVGMLLSVGKQVCDGLAEAHNLGVVHRDLKPQNIMIDKNGNAKIMDFGIARLVREKGITGPSVMIGTPEYMSPEQAEAKEIDHRSDIYSLGVILYEMATSHVPFEGETALSVAMKHKGEVPKNPKQLNPHIPDDLGAVILKCLEKDKARRYQSASDVHSELEKIEKGIPTTERVVPERKTITSREITVKFTLRKIAIPALGFLALAAIAMVIFRFIPKKQSGPPLPSGKPSLAIVYFENISGDKSLDAWKTGLTELLITKLSQSKFINVLSSDRVFSILKRLNLQEAKKYSTEDLVKVADEGGAVYTVSGSLMKAGKTIIMTLTLQKPRTGEVISPLNIECNGEEEIFTKVDELARTIKSDMNLSPDQIATDINKEANKITTSFPEAYKYYSEGRRYHNNYEFHMSIPLMEKAIGIDPGFAMAYRSLAMSYSGLGDNAEYNKYIQKALDLSDRVSDRERYIIQAEYYKGAGKAFDKAIEVYDRLLALYPDDFNGNVGLADIYYELNEWDKTIDLSERAIRSHDDSIYPYLYITYAYLAKGQYQKAKEAPDFYLRTFGDNFNMYWLLSLINLNQGKYGPALFDVEKAIKLNSNDFDNIMLRGCIYLCQADFKEAHKDFYRGLDLVDHELRYTHTGILTYLFTVQGKYVDARTQLGLDLEASIKHKDWEREGLARLRLAYLEYRLKNYDRAMEECDRALAIVAAYDGDQMASLFWKTMIFVEMNQLDKAQQTAVELKSLIEKKMNRDIRGLDLLAGMIELRKNNFGQSVEYLQQAISLMPFQYLWGKDNSLYLDCLARAYYKSGDLDKARKEYEKITSLTTGRIAYGDIYPISFYMQGKIAEQQGDKARASQNYLKFLDLWKDADPGLPEVEDARKRLAGLKGS